MSKFIRTLLPLFLISALHAQTERATLRGTVTDPSGAVVTNAEVVVTDMATDLAARQVMTDPNGNYEIPDLRPGAYRVRTTLPGFREFRADNVVIDPGQTRRLDIRLALGSTSETVTVEAGAALIQTEGGTLTGHIDTKLRWNDNPAVDVYPSPLSLLTTTGIKGIPTNGWRIVMSGISNRDQQTWALDGVANDTNADQNDNPNFFQTVEVAAVNAGADAARAASFNMVSKQGSNGFHGAAYWKEENSALNARAALPATARKSPYILHEAEVEQGGPILRDRTFFFFGWMYQNIPLGSMMTANVPTDAMRAGDFSFTGKIVRDPFNNNAPFPGNIIPPSRFSAVSKAVLDKYVPRQNVGGPNTFTSNYQWLHPYNQELYKGNWPFFRIDHKLSDKNNLYVRWMARMTPYLWAGGAGEAFNSTQYRDHRGTVISDTHVFSPTMVNSFTFGRTTDYLKQGEKEKGFVPPFGDDVVRAIGLQGTNLQGFHTMAFPTMNISGMTNLTLRNPGGYRNNVTTDDGINSFLDTFTWSRGRHVFKFGAEARRFWRYQGAVSQDVYGNFVFNGTFTGHAFADFLLGIPYTSTRLNALVARTSHQNQLGFFVNDTFKLSPKLTLDYGLRWDYYASPVFDDNLMYNWDPATGNVVVARGALSKTSPLYPTSLIKLVEGNVVPSPTLANYRPRISAAYRLNDRTVVRGGYGEFTATYGYYFGLLTGGPFQVGETYTNRFSDNTPLLQFPNPFPSSLALATVPGQSITGVPMDMTNGVIRQFNLTAERQVGSLGVRLSYIGSRGSDMLYSLNTNKPPASTIPFTPSRNPYPQFTSTTVYRKDGAWRYNALQAEVQKRAGPLTFNSNFTWGSNMSNYLNTQDPYNVTRNWARSADDRRLYWVTSGMWALPVGKGQRFLNNLPAVADHAVGGWSMQFITTFATGGYFSPAFSGSDPSHTNTSGGLPDCIGNPRSGPQTISQYYNPAAFAVPQHGRYGNCNVNVLEGYPVHVGHLSLAKTFTITERIKSTFTAQVSNFTNTPHYQNPNNNISNPNFGMFTAVIPNYMPEKQGYRQIALKLRLTW